MDRNILEEYQSQVEDILKILGDNPEIVITGVDESRIETENRLEELQNSLSQLEEQPIDMSDVGIGSLGGFMRDRRTTTIRESYSDDREGYLLSEYDKRRIDPDEPTANVEKVVAEIRKVREEKREASKAAIRDEIGKMEVKQATIESVSEALETKAQITTALQQAIVDITENVKKKLASIDEANKRESEAIEDSDRYLETLKLLEGTKSNKVYTVAKEEMEKCKEKAKNARVRVARIQRKIAHLQEDLAKIELLLNNMTRMDNKLFELKNQENQAWEEYEQEQAAEREQQEARIQDETDKAYAEKAATERAEEQKIEDETTKEVEEYYSDLDKPETENNGQGKPSGKGRDIPQKPNPSGPQAPRTEESKPQPQKPQEQAAKPPRKGEWQIESVSFSIEGGSQPVYKVIVSKGEEKQEVTSSEIATLDSDLDREEIERLQRHLIPKADRFYDKGLAIALQKADEMYNTDGLHKYIKTLQDKEIIFDKPDIHKPSLKIDYDFSGLMVKPSEELKMLQKVAKADHKKKILSGFKGRPNFLMRWIKRIFAISLPEITPGKLKDIEEEPEVATQETGDMTPDLEDRTMKNWVMMHDEEGFDIEFFVEGMPEEEADHYRSLQQEYEDAARQHENPYKGFRDRLKEKIVGGGQQEAETEETRKDNTIPFRQEEQKEQEDIGNR